MIDSSAELRAARAMAGSSGVHRPPGHAEVAAAGVVLAGVMLAQVAVADGGILFTRPLWLDEMHTVLVASLPHMTCSQRCAEGPTSIRRSSTFLSGCSSDSSGP